MTTAVLFVCEREREGRMRGLCAGLKLESEFPVQDLKSGQGGLLQVCMEGIGLLFANTKVQ